MYADECGGGQHFDKTPMLPTFQRCAQPSYPTGGVGVDRLCRFIAQTVKDTSSAFIVAFIRSYLVRQAKPDASCWLKGISHGTCSFTM
jgi:hypothetical protein